jgi:diguanylate cyclase (GGDEF)-like protein
MNYNSLPSLIALAILVAVFRSIMYQSSVERLRLWLIAWVLVLLHVIALFLDPGSGRWHRALLVVNLDCLELAGIAFLISFARVAADRHRRRMLATVLGVSSLTYTNATIWGVTTPWLYYVLTAGAVAATMLLVWNFFRIITTYVAGIFAGCLAVACAVTLVIANGRPEFGDDLILAAIYFFASVLYWHSYQRWTAGVLTSVLGFMAWGLVFPIGIFLDTFSPSLPIQSETWNLPKYFVAIGMILTLLEDQIKEKEHLALYDALTGIPNRRLLVDRLERALVRAERQRSKLAVLVLDIDKFKAVNDNFGHSFGDLVLKAVVARLAASLRASDTLSRTGGDEFTVVSDVSDAPAAKVLVSTLCSAFVDPLEVDGRFVNVGISIGPALYPDDGRTADELRGAADSAMYVAKRAGSHPSL